MKKFFTLMFRLLFLGLLVFAFTAKTIAQVTLLDQSVVTEDAFFFWKPDDPKPFKYGSTINPHGNCVKVFNDFVFYTWYRGGWDDRTLMVSRKKIGSGQWKHVELPGKLSLIGQGYGDTHLTTNIGICPIDGTIHIMYDHHNEDLNYIRSKKGIAFGSDADFVASNFLPQQDYLIPGQKVTGVSYPNLFNNDGGEMFFERRLGSAVGGNIIITFYDGTKWSEEKMVTKGAGDGVSQGERNYCYGKAFPINGTVYYSYSVRWAESPTEANEGVYIMDLGPYMNKSATTVNGVSYDLPIIDHNPFLIHDPTFNGDYGSGTFPHLAVSPKGDIYSTYNPRNTDNYNFLRKAGEKEFEVLRNKGDLGQFYGNRMYKFEETGGYLYVKSCLAGTFVWRTDLQVNVGSNLDKSVIIMNDGYIAAVFKESKASATVPIHCFVFKITKSEYTPQTITLATIPEKTEGTADFAVTATATSKLPVKLSSSNPNIARIVENNKVKIMGVGSCDIIANQAGNGEFDNAPEVKKTLTVNANTAKQNQSLNFNLATAYYVWGSGDIALGATASSGLAVQYESSDTAVAIIENGKIKVKRAGKTTINALQIGNSTYNAAPIVGHELNVPIRKQVITVEAMPDFTSGDKQYTIKATSNNPNAKLRFVCPNNQVAIVWRNNVREALGTGSATIDITEEGDQYFTPVKTTLPIIVKPKTHIVPCEIEAEHYTTKTGVNVARWSNSVFFLNSWGTGDVAEYTVDVPKDGTYQVEIFTGCPSTGKKLKVMSDAKTLAIATLVKTPSLTVFKGVKVNVNLSKGVQNIKIVGVTGGYNFDKMIISSNDGGTVVDPGNGDDSGTVDPSMPDYVIAQSYTIAASDGAQEPNVPTNLYDGKINDESRWSANGYPKSVTIDLGEEMDIIGTRVWTYQSRLYQYKIEMSNSATDGFVKVVDRLNHTSKVQPIADDFETKRARFVKLTVDTCFEYASTWISINELALIFDDTSSDISTDEGFPDDETEIDDTTDNSSTDDDTIIDDTTDNSSTDDDTIIDDTVNINPVIADDASLCLYPNPTNSSFRIKIEGMKEATIQIFQINGKTIYNEPYNQKDITLSKGIYIVKVIGSNNEVYHRKLVVQ